MKSPVKRILADLLAPPPAPKPEGFVKAAEQVILADHLAAYEWALAYAAGKDVLEIGVNRGNGSRMLAAEARSFMGVELLHDLAMEARKDTGLAILQADGMKLPLADETVDVVVAFHVIEHAWHDRAFLHELIRVLRPEGVCILSSPQSRYRQLYGQAPWSEWHSREYDESTWSKLLTENFARVQVFGEFAKGIVGAVERRLVYQDPWNHYLGGPWANPLRFIGRKIVGLRRTGKLGGDEVQKIAGTKAEELLGYFFFDNECLQDALDLLAVCQKEKEGGGKQGATFDTRHYWRERLRAHQGLQGTGTSLAPEAWQRWLYRGKERAYRRLLRRNGVGLRGKNVLDFGCGTGYFEDVWERWGAARADGIDFVPEVIEGLGRAHPERRYLAADLAEDAGALASFEPVFLLTAIDVLYHIVDDERLVATLKPLSGLLAQDGYFLFTDALAEQETGEHVRFRSLNQWRQILARLGLEVIDREPVFALNNRLHPWARRFPGMTGALQHLLDLPFLRTMPWLANNCAVLARRKGA